MNMSFLPGSKNSTPQTDEDDSGRRFYYREILRLHRRTKLRVPPGPKYSKISCLCKRVSLISHLLLCLKSRKITKKEYIELSQRLNIDIILELGKRKLINSNDW